MRCVNCAFDIPAELRFCPQCGTVITGRAAPPAAAQSGAPRAADEAAVPLWNPNAASGWSVLFTPAFGSYLHALNWRAVGEHDKARVSKRWFYVSVLILLLRLVSAAQAPAPDGSPNLVGLLWIPYLIIWYIMAGRVQGTYVTKKFGSKYPRRAWTTPLFFAFAAFIASVLAFMIVAPAPLPG